MHKLLAVAAMAAALVCTGAPARAEMVRRDEAGAAVFVLTAPVAPGGEAIEVAQGAVAWTETVRPQSAVRITVDAPTRNGPGRTVGPAAGSVLFGYAMEYGGESFCPLGPPGSARVQCYRDFDADGDFDASYVSIPLGRDYVLKVGRLTRLTPVRQLAFEIVAAEAMPRLQAALMFDGWRGETARFSLRTADERLGAFTCEPAADGACTLLGLTLRVEATAGGGARIAVLAAEPERQLRLDFT